MTKGRSMDPVGFRGKPVARVSQQTGFPATEDRILIWFERAWNDGAKTVIGELMSTEAEVLGLGTSVMNAAAFIETLRSFHETFDQILVEVVDLVCGEDERAGHARFSGVHRSSGREVDLLFSFAVRFEDGRIVWLRHVFDYAAMLSQLGTLDPRAIGLIFRN